MGARDSRLDRTLQQLHGRLGQSGQPLGTGRQKPPDRDGLCAPGAHTCEFLERGDTFTVSFYPPEYRRALGYIGSHSGRDGDKAAAAGLTPLAFGQGVTYAEANLTFLCKKLYQHQFTTEDLAPEVQAYYASMPQVYPDFHGGWQPHIAFVGEIIDVIDKR